VKKSQSNPSPKLGTKPTYIARLDADEAVARRISTHLMETMDPDAAVCSAFEQPDKRWRIELHFADKPDLKQLRSMIAAAASEALARRLVVEKVPARDWVKESLTGLAPVSAGRFLVHGAHDRARVPSNRIGIEIEAAVAFGTGHHGTTRGCLLALDRVARSSRPRYVLDLGTGTGVLAIAAARRLRTPVVATDIDPGSVRAARDNARKNRVGGLIQPVHAAGLTAHRIRSRAPYELVLANILLTPLQRLAAPLARSLSPRAYVILSGVLASQAAAAISTYRTQGLRLERRIPLGEWVTLVMVAGR
jgi:ribosomal protein L11 methyltransferase